ncbi:hypothetical protein AB1L88_05135 [Tautonia sp. JC769]|uniref:hypothetical protein n=1 Tax=Tautonia sp. JC769 TaxID=3232135 RepID=UPI0034583952
MAIRSLVPCVMGMLGGLLLGWLAASYSTPSLRAGQGDRSGDSILATGPVSVEMDRVTRQLSTTDAVYYLDYSRGRLLATIPALKQTVSGTEVLGDFATRDLVADFQPPRGATPRFVMTVGQLGLGTGTGWAPLYVLETRSNTMATYRLTPGPLRPGAEQPPTFELLELKQLP